METLKNSKLSSYNKVIAYNIRRHRRMGGLVQSEVAKILGVNKSTISLYENAKITVPANYLLAIADILKIDPTALLNK